MEAMILSIILLIKKYIEKNDFFFIFILSQET